MGADNVAREAALAARRPTTNVLYEFCGRYGQIDVVIQNGDLHSPWFERKSINRMLESADYDADDADEEEEEQEEEQEQRLLSYLAKEEMATLYNVDDRVWIAPKASIDVISPTGLFKLLRLASNQKISLIFARSVRWEMLPAIRRGDLPPPCRPTATDIFGHHDFAFEGDVVRAHACVGERLTYFNLVDIGQRGKINNLRSLRPELRDWDALLTVEDSECLDADAVPDLIEKGWPGDPERLLRLVEAYEKTGRDEAYVAAISRIRRHAQAGAAR
jgi:hypothetical protein